MVGKTARVTSPSRSRPLSAKVIAESRLSRRKFACHPANAGGCRKQRLAPISALQKSGEKIMLERKLGSTGPAESAIGLGCMGMSDLYGPADRAESIATIHAALDAGVTLLDTGDFYGMGHNELLIHE